MSNLDTDAITLPDVKVLQVIYEIDDSVMAELLPPALHPTIPPTMHVIGLRADDGPLGAFTLATVRVGCRAAVRPRGLPTRAVCTGGEAATALRERWGFPITIGEPILRERYDRQSIEVNDGNVTVLSAQLIDPVPIGNWDLLYTAGMHIANVERDGETKPWLVQVDPELRGQPRRPRYRPDRRLRQQLLGYPKPCGRSIQSSPATPPPISPCPRSATSATHCSPPSPAPSPSDPP